MDQGSIGAVEAGLQLGNSEVLVKHKKLLGLSLLLWPVVHLFCSKSHSCLSLVAY